LETVNQETSIGLVGYCLGGKLAYLAACRIPELGCAVSYYGVGIEQNLDEAKNIKSKLVSHFAELDQFSDTNTREKILSA
ncbi:dienelactone hydrolase family protein, partial [Siminovitchia fortis]|uniref:dienelactone hydrolase family protein n=3 Tax=Bacteria TaxID=2 RepID=UPI001643B62A